VIDSIIGADKKAIIENFLTQRPVKHEVAEGDTVFNALLLETDKKTGLAKSIERIQIRPVSV
jgi:calcineurin-like phosphoesterase